MNDYRITVQSNPIQSNQNINCKEESSWRECNHTLEAHLSRIPGIKMLKSSVTSMRKMLKHSVTSIRRMVTSSSNSVAKEKVECVVIGAGVVGIAIARELALKGKEVLVIESGPTFGTGTSSRNSEVFHAGIYYPLNSLKVFVFQFITYFYVDFIDDYMFMGNFFVADKYLYVVCWGLVLLLLLIFWVAPILVLLINVSIKIGTCILVNPKWNTSIDRQFSV